MRCAPSRSANSSATPAMPCPRRCAASIRARAGRVRRALLDDRPRNSTDQQKRRGRVLFLDDRRSIGGAEHGGFHNAVQACSSACVARRLAGSDAHITRTMPPVGCRAQTAVRNLHRLVVAERGLRGLCAPRHDRPACASDDIQRRRRPTVSSLWHDARLRPSDGAVAVACRGFYAGALPGPGLVKHYPGLVLSRTIPPTSSTGNSPARTRRAAARVRHVRGLRRGLFAADEYVRQMLPVMLADGSMSEAAHAYNWPVAGLPRVEFGQVPVTLISCGHSGPCAASNLRCAIAHRGISRFSVRS